MQHESTVTTSAANVPEQPAAERRRPNDRGDPAAESSHREDQPDRADALPGVSAVAGSARYRLHGSIVKSCPQDQAPDALRRASQRENVKVRGLALHDEGPGRSRYVPPGP